MGGGDNPYVTSINHAYKFTGDEVQELTITEGGVFLDLRNNVKTFTIILSEKAIESADEEEDAKVNLALLIEGTDTSVLMSKKLFGFMQHQGISYTTYEIYNKDNQVVFNVNCLFYNAS